VIKFEKYEWEKFIAIFKVFLLQYDGYWKNNNEIFRSYIEKRYILNGNEFFKIQTLYDKIGDGMEKSPNSIRKLEE
jgi:hypothetical protein